MAAPPPARLFHAGALSEAARVRLDADASHHALRVLRLAVGDAVELFNGDGRRYRARLLDADPRGATVETGAAVEAGTESPLAIGLAQALPAGDKMDWVVEKAVELGVLAIQPLFSRKSLLRLDGARAERRLAHWRRIAVAACMQCGRDRVPTIAAPLPLGAWLARAPVAPAACLPPGPDAVAADRTGSAAAPVMRLLLSPRGEGVLHTLAAPLPPLWLLAGPEGGLADDEEAQALAAGWRPLRLGPRILRTETAGLAALAALQARLGDF
jgi:16S rRNA (uracil1498-N3)-methyltransferase